MGASDITMPTALPRRKGSVCNLKVKYLSLKYPSDIKCNTNHIIVDIILGVLGIVLNRSNLTIMLMSIELMLLAISFLFLINSVGIDNLI